MSQAELYVKQSRTISEYFQAKVLSTVCLLALGLGGCVSHTEMKQAAGQEQLGKGIVAGTLGYQAIQKKMASPGAFSLVLEGQVVKIEGAAYVVQDITEEEYRIPLDQNTRIDRPAHKGDWIAAYLDSHGRATHIRNIDEEFMTRDAPIELK